MIKALFSKVFGRRKANVNAQQLQALQRLSATQAAKKPSSLPPSYLDVNSLFK